MIPRQPCFYSPALACAVLSGLPPQDPQPGSGTRGREPAQRLSSLGCPCPASGLDTITRLFRSLEAKLSVIQVEEPQENKSYFIHVTA